MFTISFSLLQLFCRIIVSPPPHTHTLILSLLSLCSTISIPIVFYSIFNVLCALVAFWYLLVIT